VAPLLYNHTCADRRVPATHGLSPLPCYSRAVCRAARQPSPTHTCSVLRRGPRTHDRWLRLTQRRRGLSTDAHPPARVPLDRLLPLSLSLSWWQHLPPPPAGTPCPGWFATHISGEAYALLALCLRRQLVHHRTGCPMLVVVDDLTKGRNLSAGTTAALMAELEVVTLSSLVSRAFSEHDMSWPPPRDARAAGGASHTVAAPMQQVTHHNHFASAGNKHYLWALDPSRYPLVAYLDVDTLVLQNVDALLHVRFQERIAAVTSGPICNSHASFNSGVMVLKPSLETLAWLLLGERFAAWPWKGRVPRFHAARLDRGARQPVALVHASTRDAAHGGGAADSRAADGRAHEHELRPSWVETCAPAGCTKGNFLHCMGGGPAVSIGTNHTAAAAAAAATTTTNTASLEACKKQTGGSYSWSRRLRKTCEPSPRDQSVLNWHFNDSKRWHALPRCYNVQSALWRVAERAGVLKPGGPGEVCVVHFAGGGGDKPWRRSARPEVPEKLVQLWRGSCPSLVPRIVSALRTAA
jgi:hypothetical protein